ncbi:hypothetical protein HOW07_14290 [Plantibacter sp. MCCC 1A11337]|uniref:hypothetical protein n=1 Tax=Plantibacter sp. MCCC 1A11337 TaxID=2736644 RepID=UPI001581768F|nr:hypothetical protein [Plantibacter sp. MCCC 1A11337]NUJ89179.1 hypothetical protein [Plantibacter sp. MCCC 1A11337]
MEHAEVWRPWDASDEEYATRLTAREMLPDHVRPAIQSWLETQLNTGYQQTSSPLRSYIETSLQARFSFEPGSVHTELLVNAIFERGDRFVVQVIDLLVSDHERDTMYRAPAQIAQVADYLDLAASSVAVVNDERSFRIGRRLPDGVEEIASEAAASAGETAGHHLTAAWATATALDPDPSKAMTEAIRAVEAAAGAVVTPKDRRPRLSKIVSAIKDASSWTLVFETRDDGHPDHRLVLIGMLETLVFAQRDRHGGPAPDPAVALGHVQLASTLVSWFATGIVQRATD